MIVVDTHIIIWNALKPEMLFERAERAISAGLFSDNEKDPAARIIAATSIIEKANVVTADNEPRQSKKVSTVW
jgi:PIN domain nuclease of toxin-antitoxin system